MNFIPRLDIVFAEQRLKKEVALIKYKVKIAISDSVDRETLVEFLSEYSIHNYLSEELGKATYGSAQAHIFAFEVR